VEKKCPTLKRKKNRVCVDGRKRASFTVKVHTEVLSDPYHTTKEEAREVREFSHIFDE
jgi:hypothetical protein